MKLLASSSAAAGASAGRRTLQPPLSPTLAAPGSNPAAMYLPDMIGGVMAIYRSTDWSAPLPTDL